MRIIARSRLKAFWHKHTDAEQPLKAWHAEVERESWNTPQDIRNRYASASFLANNRVVFNIKGNHYRLVALVQYRVKLVFIRFIGTHQEYDQIDAANI